MTLVLPPGWKTSVTGLPAAADQKPHHYVAADFDTLVDSPLYAGSPAIYEFQVDGVAHYLVNEGEGGLWDGPRSARDVEAIVRAQKAFWGSLPYEKYVFFNLLTESGGGLEHKNSTVLMASRWATRTRSSYLSWLNLVSHEFFHTWNVKRMRPVELGPFDYESEVYTPSLWVAEGITSYYDRLLVRRAGLCSVEEYLAGDPPAPSSDSDKPTNDIERLQTTPGRLVQPLEASSFDAWIKFYRRDENTPNTGTSYYVKGAVVGFLLDAKIRRATDGKEEPRRRDAAGLRAAIRAPRASRPSSSAPPRKRLPASICRPGSARSSRPPASSITPRPSSGSAFDSPRTRKRIIMPTSLPRPGSVL